MKFVICDNMDGPGKYYASEINRTGKDKYHVFTYMWNLKSKELNEYNKTETNSQIQRASGYQRGEGQGEGQNS